MKTSQLFSVVAAVLIICCNQHAKAQLAQKDAPANSTIAAAWRAMIKEDLHYLDGVIRVNYIYAL